MTFPSFSKRQMLALTWWNRPRFRQFDAIICDGAVRSGKTVSTVGGFFLWSMATFDRQVFAICGKSVSSLRRNIIIHLAAWLGGGFFITEQRGENKLTVRCAGKENTYYLFGGQDESSYMSVQGITLAGVLLDEVALMPRSFVEQACARCSVKGSKLWFNCNPAGPEHWFYKEWVCKAKEKRALHLHFTMADNPGLDPEIRNRYERLYRGVFYDRYVRGLWCLAEGLIYDFRPEKHITGDVPRGRYYISVDYGTMNPFSAGLWCVSKGKAVRIREFYYCGREKGKALTDEEYYAVAGSCFSGSFGALENTLTLSCTLPDGTAVALTPEIDGEAYRAEGSFEGLTPGERIVLTAADAVMTVTETVVVPRAVPVFHWGEDQFSVNVPASISGVHMGTFEGESISVNAPQGVLVCGAGVLGVADSSGWQGTAGVTVTTDENGDLNIQLPQGTQQVMLLSPGEIIRV